MRLGTVTKVSYAVTVGLAVLSISLLLLAIWSVEEERRSIDQYNDSRKLAGDLVDVVNRLSNEARRYTIFGEKAFYDNYLKEVRENRAREVTVDKIKSMGSPPDETGMIDEAKSISDHIVSLEESAMKAVRDGDIVFAQDIIFGAKYEKSKSDFEEVISRFNHAFTSRTHGAAREARHQAQTMLSALQFIIVFMAIVFISIVYGVLNRRIIKPLSRVNDAVIEIAKQNYSIDFPGRDRQDEIGDIARAVYSLKEAGMERKKYEEQIVIESKNKERRASIVDRITHDFEEKMGRSLCAVSNAADELYMSARTMADVANNAKHEAGSTSSAANQTSANVHAAAIASKNMIQSLQAIAKQVNKSTEIAFQAVQQTNQTNATIFGLSEAAQRIGEVVQMISKIASKTNLLSLNATIEAARAGEAGKGFSVVASEVKALAMQTARATEEISYQIAAMQDATNNAVTTIRGICTTITAISEITTATSSTIEEQCAAVIGISENVHLAADGASGVSDSISKVTIITASTGSTSENVLGASKELSKEADMLRTEVSSFIAAIRAA